MLASLHKVFLKHFMIDLKMGIHQADQPGVIPEEFVWHLMPDLKTVISQVDLPRALVSSHKDNYRHVLLLLQSLSNI